MFDDFDQERHFRELWDAVRIERPVAYSLFTFGDSELPYFLVMSQDDDSKVIIRQGKVTVSRARIITPDSMQPVSRLLRRK